MPRSTRTRAATPVPARSAPTGIVAFCAGLMLAALALLMLDVTRGGLTVPAALALLGVVLAGSLVVALIFGRGKIRVPSLLWEVLPFWTMFALAAEQVLGATAALATALLYPAVALGLPFVVPRSWLRAEPCPWMDRDNTGDDDTSSRDGGDTAG